MKKILSFFLAVILMLSTVSVLSFAAEEYAESQKKLENGTVVLNSVKNSAKGIKIKWQKNKYAKKYRIYRKSDSQKSWTKLTDIKSNSTLSFTDTAVKSGKKYKYTVKGFNGTAKSGYDKKGLSFTFLTVPEPGTKITSGGVNVSWQNVKGATGYNVYRKAVTDDAWTKLAYTKETSYTDKNATPLTDYYYTVKAVASDKSVSSHYENRCLTRILKTPAVKLIDTGDGIKIKWNKSAGTTEYRIYVRKSTVKSWTLLKKISSKNCKYEYTDKTAVRGTKYFYTVKAFGSKTNSGWSTKSSITKGGTFEHPLTITIDKNNPYLTVINANYRIPGNYNPSLTYVCNSGERLESTVAKAYEKMYSAAAKQGVYLTPCSGYRSYDLQKRNYDNETAYFENRGYSHKEALKKAAESIMPPGASEHNLGYAMDILCVEDWFEDSPQFTWLMKNADKYGFILRYPKDKTKITKVIYEPWHWRYVGTEYAKKIKASGKCMEEYFGIY